MKAILDLWEMAWIKLEKRMAHDIKVSLSFGLGQIREKNIKVETS